MAVHVEVNSEVGRLEVVLVHSPDSGLGMVVPSKAQDWLFEDIIHLDTIRSGEYDYYTKLLLHFLDPSVIQGKKKQIEEDTARHYFQPDHEDFFQSDKVLELQKLLAEVLEDPTVKAQLVASVCALEGCTYKQQLMMDQLSARPLAKLFITGTLADKTMIFPPIPNFIFTRDIGIVINDYILLNKPAKQARVREALLARYLFFNHVYFSNYQNNIIELQSSPRQFLLPDDDDEVGVTLEGGDVMVVSSNHVLIGVSERTSAQAAEQVVKILLDKDIVEKVSVVHIPAKRDYMHIDTIFTQVSRNIWVLLASFSKKAVYGEVEDVIRKKLNTYPAGEKVAVIQFQKGKIEDPVVMDNLEDLMIDISVNDLGCKEKVEFIYSGDDVFPFDVREQWTDSCNVLALKEGVVLGYDRNDKTTEAFKKKGFKVWHVRDVLHDLETGKIQVNDIEKTLIIFPSAELSRARGGFHCMSMPLKRTPLTL